LREKPADLKVYADRADPTAMGRHPVQPAVAARAGLSLVEMLLVLLVMAIVAAMVIPVLRSTDSDRLQWAAIQLESDIVFAQAESFVRPDDRRVLVFDTALNRYFLAAESDPSVPLTHPITGRPHVVAYGRDDFQHMRGVSIQAYSLDGDNRLGFGHYGQLDQSTDATITLAIDGHTRTVTIQAATGFVSTD
jgi:prepilin-type N-terminal cleavage/methylation domain-containing protein